MLSQFIAKYQYPHRLFAKEICTAINKYNLSDIVLLDAPCGNGETTYYFSKKLKCKEVYGLDISEKAITIAKNNFFDRNITWAVKNIYDALDGKKKYDIICIINSLFLLPDAKEILRNVKNSLSTSGLLFIIVPNIRSENYNHLPQVYKELNKLVLNFEEISLFLIENGFNILSSKGIARANLYGRKELKFFSVLSPFYLHTLNTIYYLFKINKPGYFLFELKNAEK